MGKIISVHSYRGGTGKSNLTANLGVAIAKTGKRVAIVDCDIQSPGVHVIFRLDEKNFTYSLNDYLYHRCQIEQAAYDVTVASIGTANPAEERPKLYMVPSSTKTGEIGRVLKEGYDVALLNDGFNSISLDEASNRPFNPMINAGAIAAADLIMGQDYPERVSRMLGMLQRYCGRAVHINNSVFASERATGHRNRAIAHLMLNFDMISPNLEQTLDLYFQQCSVVLVNCHDLAVMGATLANDGINPITRQRAIDEQYVKDLLSVMYTCGMYDIAGEWGYRVGIPAKSGVGGGIVAVVPGKVGIGTYSPRLDSKGNSVRGIKALKELSEKFKLHVFEGRSGGSASGSSILNQFLPSKGLD